MRHLTAFILVFFLHLNVSAYQSLQEVYDQAQPDGEYSKYIELDPDIEYVGDLQIFNGQNVYINGHGAIIYGESSDLVIGVYSSNLDIENCVIVGGYGGIYISNLSSGNIYSNTIIGCEEAGIRTYYIDRNVDTEIWDNIITDCDYGVFGVEDELPDYVAFNDIYNISEMPYAQFCPD